MKSVAKLIKLVVLIVVILVLVLFSVFYLFGEHAIKAGIEAAGTKALNVGVDIDDLDLAILKGRVELKGLTIKNPPGYEHEQLLELGKARVETSIGSLMSDTVRIKTINLDGINLTIEQKGLTNNLRDIIKSIPASEQQRAQKQEPAEEGKKLHIDELEITNVNVKVKLLPIPGKADDTVTLTLDPIKMNNLGSDNKLDMTKLSTKIMLAITNGIVKQGAGILPDDIVNTMQASLDKALDAGKAAVEEGKKLLDAGKKEGGQLLDTGKETGKDIVEGFKGLIKPKK